MEEVQNEIVLNDEVVEESGFDTEGLLPQEVELAKQHGLVKEEKEEEEDGKQPESKEVETNDDTGTEEKEESKEDESEEEIDTDPDNFEAMDKVFKKDENRRY